MVSRIEVNPKILAGKPVIRGTRIPVYLILNLIAKGKTAAQITKEYPELNKEDVNSAVSYAASHMEYEETNNLETIG